MTKIKGLWLLIIGAVLAIFAAQNWHYPDPPIHFLGFRFLPLPHPLIIFSCFLLGFLTGWLVHAWRLKKQKQEGLPKPPLEV